MMVLIVEGRPSKGSRASTDARKSSRSLSAYTEAGSGLRFLTHTRTHADNYYQYYEYWNQYLYHFYIYIYRERECVCVYIVHTCICT